MNHHSKKESLPWYRQFWPWFIIAILAWGVVSASITLSVAVRNPPHMMTGDYEKLGKLLVDTHERADRAEALGLAGRLRLTPSGWHLVLDATAPGQLPAGLLLLIQHPTDSARDGQVILDRSAAGQYRAEWTEIPERGRVIVSDLEQRWWISSRYRREGEELEVALRPKRL